MTCAFCFKKKSYLLDKQKPNYVGDQKAQDYFQHSIYI